MIIYSDTIISENVMSLNRRQFVVGAGAAVGMAGLTTTVLADDDNDDDVPVEIAEVFPVADVVILENTGDDDVDLEGFVFDFLHDADTDYTDEIDEDVTLEAGETVSIWTGFQSTQIEDVEADVQIGEFDNGRINAQEDEVIALLDADGQVVDETDETSDDGQSYEDHVADQDDSDDGLEGEFSAPDGFAVTSVELIEDHEQYGCALSVTVENNTEEIWTIEIQGTVYDEGGDALASFGDPWPELDPGESREIVADVRRSDICDQIASYEGTIGFPGGENDGEAPDDENGDDDTADDGSDEDPSDDNGDDNGESDDDSGDLDEDESDDKSDELDEDCPEDDDEDDDEDEDCPEEDEPEDEPEEEDC